MQVIKATYRAGNIELLSPLPGIQEADLLVIVLDPQADPATPASPNRDMTSNPENDFNALGIASFFDTREDSQVNWEEVFDVEPR